MVNYGQFIALMMCTVCMMQLFSVLQLRQSS